MISSSMPQQMKCRAQDVTAAFPRGHTSAARSSARLMTTLSVCMIGGALVDPAVRPTIETAAAGTRLACDPPHRAVKAHTRVHSPHRGQTYRRAALLLCIMAGITRRLATKADLPAIHELIRASFDAMNEHSCIPYIFGPDFWRRSANDLINKELCDSEFTSLYITHPANRFWVAEQTTGGEVGYGEISGTVVGCVGLKFPDGSGPTAELVRMAVSPGLRGGGVGGALLQELVAHAKVVLSAHPSCLCHALPLLAPVSPPSHAHTCVFSDAHSHTPPHTCPRLPAALRPRACRCYTSPRATRAPPSSTASTISRRK